MSRTVRGAKAFHRKGSKSCACVTCHETRRRLARRRQADPDRRKR